MRVLIYVTISCSLSSVFRWVYVKLQRGLNEERLLTGGRDSARQHCFLHWLGRMRAKEDSDSPYWCGRPTQIEENDDKSTFDGSRE